MEAGIQDGQDIDGIVGEEFGEGHADLGRSHPSGEVAEPFQREERVPAARGRREVVEVCLRDLLREPRSFRAEGKGDHLRHHRGAAKDPRDPGTKEGDGPARLDALVDEEGQPDGELSTQPAAGDPGLEENPAPPERHRADPIRIRRAALIPVEGLRAQDRADQQRVLRLGADPGQQRFGRPEDLAQDSFVAVRLPDQSLRVDRVDRLDVELLLGVHLQERHELSGFRPRGGLKFGGRLQGVPGLPRFLRRRRNGGREHR